MRTALYPHEIFTRFDLLDAKTLDTNELLTSQIPEEVLMAVLGNYKREDAEVILRKIVGKLKTIVHNKRVLKRYINQLMMLSRLRKIEGLTIKISEEMPIQFDYETDTLFLRGSEIGIEKGIAISAVRLWKNGVEPPMIANLLDLPIEDVERIIAESKKDEAHKAAHKK